MKHLWQNSPAALAEFARPDGDAYFVTVVFRRSVNDDRGVIEPAAFTAESTRVQFVRELQDAYNDSGMAGLFEVAEVRLRPEQVEASQ